MLELLFKSQTAVSCQLFYCKIIFDGQNKNQNAFFWSKFLFKIIKNGIYAECHKKSNTYYMNSNHSEHTYIHSHKFTPETNLSVVWMDGTSSGTGTGLGELKKRNLCIKHFQWMD